jgi:hypothetical protein
MAKAPKEKAESRQARNDDRRPHSPIDGPARRHAVSTALRDIISSSGISREDFQDKVGIEQASKLSRLLDLQESDRPQLSLIQLIAEVIEAGLSNKNFESSDDHAPGSAWRRFLRRRPKAQRARFLQSFSGRDEPEVGDSVPLTPAEELHWQQISRAETRIIATHTLAESLIPRFRDWTHQLLMGKYGKISRIYFIIPETEVPNFNRMLQRFRHMPDNDEEQLLQKLRCIQTQRTGPFTSYRLDDPFGDSPWTSGVMCHGKTGSAVAIPLRQDEWTDVSNHYGTVCNDAEYALQTRAKMSDITEGKNYELVYPATDEIDPNTSLRIGSSRSGLRKA